MGEALAKSKGALDQIRDMGEGYDGANMAHLDLMTLARTQAEIAQAEALQEIVVAINRLADRVRPSMFASSHRNREAGM